MSGRKMTPKGQMTRGTNSGPAVMMMPPHIRATFMPNPPLKHIPPMKNKRKHPITGVMQFLDKFENTTPPERQTALTPKAIKEMRTRQQKSAQERKIEPLVEEYRKEQRDCGGDFQGMNCYNTLFVGRLAYEVTERKLLREMEAFGPVKDIKLIFDQNGRSRGYGFVEYENEEDMKRAYRAADGMKIEGREIVVDVERGHTVPTWLPRRLGGGLGGRRLGGKDQNVTAPGRFDPSRPDLSRGVAPMMDGPPGGMGRGQPPMYGGGGGGGGGVGFDGRGGQHNGFRDGPPGPYGAPGGYGGGGGGGGGFGGPPRGRGDWGGGNDRGGHGDSGRRRRRSRSRSPDRRYAPRPRY